MFGEHSDLISLSVLGPGVVQRHKSLEKMQNVNRANYLGAKISRDCFSFIRFCAFVKYLQRI